MKSIRIVSRKSPLAMRQSEIVAAALQSTASRELGLELDVEIMGVTTSGDRRALGFAGKSDFTKELEHALLAGDADLAVHSMKDVAVRLPAGLEIGALLPRDNPYDAFVSRNYVTLENLPSQAVVGTSSLRRRCQLRHARPDLRVLDLHGNIGTRIGKLDDGEYDAIVLAAAGLRRMQLDSEIKSLLLDDMIPAIAQGAIGIENREGCGPQLRQLLRACDDRETRLRVQAERSVGCLLGADCRLPVAAHASLEDNGLLLRAMVGDSESGHLVHASAKGDTGQPEQLAAEVVDDLKRQGAERILEKLRQ